MVLRHLMAQPPRAKYEPPHQVGLPPVSIRLLSCSGIGSQQGWASGHSLRGLGVSCLEGCCVSGQGGRAGSHEGTLVPHPAQDRQLEKLTTTPPPSRAKLELPTMPLGPEQVSLAPRPPLPSPSFETLPSPATQHEQPGPPLGQANLKALERLQEGTSTGPAAARLSPDLACLLHPPPPTPPRTLSGPPAARSPSQSSQ